MTSTTQQHLIIQDIKDDAVLLKNGSAALILQTTAVNFDLLSDREQLAIIDAFAAMLNSLSFPIQIVIRSKRLNISNYLELLANAENKQPNPLLRQLMQYYRQFVAALIRENEVLDKKFYVVIPVSYLELGFFSTAQKQLQKATTILSPRRDHIIKLLSRMGLKATQLNSERLIKLFYDIYNEGLVEKIEFTNQTKLPYQLTPPQPVVAGSTPITTPPQSNPQPPISPPKTSQPQTVVQPQPIPQVRPTLTPSPNIQTRPAAANHSPFVVEELMDEYNAAT